MRETPQELESLEELLESSWSGATEHLQSIIDGERSLRATELVELLTGMKVIVLATVTAGGEPRTSALDGHFLHGSWVFGTSGSAAKAVHMSARPAVSVTHVEGERLGVFAHGLAERLLPGESRFEETLSHLTEHYGESPLGWGPDIRLYRLAASFMVGYRAGR